MERSGFSGRWYLKPGSVPYLFQCWEQKHHLNSKPPKERKLNKFQLRSIEVVIRADSRKRKAIEESSIPFEAEPVEHCVYSSEATIDNAKETETELSKLAKSRYYIVNGKVETCRQEDRRARANCA